MKLGKGKRSSTLGELCQKSAELGKVPPVQCERTGPAKLRAAQGSGCTRLLSVSAEEHREVSFYF